MEICDKKKKESLLQLGNLREATERKFLKEKFVYLTVRSRKILFSYTTYYQTKFSNVVLFFFSIQSAMLIPRDDCYGKRKIAKIDSQIQKYFIYKSVYRLLMRHRNIARKILFFFLRLPYIKLLRLEYSPLLLLPHSVLGPKIVLRIKTKRIPRSCEFISSANVSNICAAGKHVHLTIYRATC